MAVPFRRTSKTAKRKRRTHKKLSAPSITIDAATGNYVMGHRVDRKTGMYKGRQVLDVKYFKYYQNLRWKSWVFLFWINKNHREYVYLCDFFLKL